MSSTTPRIAIVGAGITGLTAGFRLMELANESGTRIDITIFEASDRVGGSIRTEHLDGFTFERGADSFITNKRAAVDLVGRLGLESELQPTDSRYRRTLVLRKGRPVPVPDGFQLLAPTNAVAFLKSPLLSLPGKLRALAERFVGRQSIDDESVGQFIRRRFGRELFERLAQPLVGGIYTADPEKLSIQATLPRFPRMEASHGSVLTGMRTEAEKTESSGARYSLFLSLNGGLQRLTEQLVGRIEAQHRVLRETEVTRICPGRLPRVAIGNEEPGQFAAVIVTTPAWVTTQLLREEPEASELVRNLGEIEYASSAIVCTTHAIADFAHDMRTFGLVVPAVEKREILAVSFASRKFENRAPEGHILLRSFLGGAMQPEILERSDDDLIATTCRELSNIFGMQRKPAHTVVTRYNRAMPQYHLGHLDRVDRIETAASAAQGVFIAGNAYRGVGIPDCVSSGERSAAQAFESLRLH